MVPRLIGVTTVQISSLYEGAIRFERHTVPTFGWSHYGTNYECLKRGRHSAEEAVRFPRLFGVTMVQISNR